MLKKIFIVLILTISAGFVQAEYNANLSGEVVDVFTYDSGVILFVLNNQPASHPGCQADFFAIDPTLAEPIINRLFSRLILAYTTKTAITIGFDNAGDCVGGWIRAHRAG